MELLKQTRHKWYVSLVYVQKKYKNTLFTSINTLFDTYDISWNAENVTRQRDKVKRRYLHDGSVDIWIIYCIIPGVLRVFIRHHLCDFASHKCLFLRLLDGNITYYPKALWLNFMRANRHKRLDFCSANMTLNWCSTMVPLWIVIILMRLSRKLFFPP